jgi:DNA-binding response OmpR family regulator
MTNYHLLWADDEIDLLKPHILYLQQKGYEITAVPSGTDALDKCQENHYDLIFLDENMPGMTGLETLAEIKKLKPNVPVVMVTKSEEESIMEEAIGAKIADYLLKPIKPQQMLLSVKKLLESKRLYSEKTNSGYQQEFAKISMAFGDDLDHNDWAEIYKKLVFWDLEIHNTESQSMLEVLQMQKTEANVNFARFVKENYRHWLDPKETDKPLLSHRLFPEVVFPLLKESKAPLFVIVIDNLRLDQWKALQEPISEFYNVESESTYYSILPTTTAFARNALFSGLLPLEMEKKYPQYWVGDDEEEGKNKFEEEFLKEHLKREKLDIKSSYHKIIHVSQGKQVYDQLNNLMNNELNVLVYNFVDMLSHARTDTEMVRELAPDEAAYRSVTLSWFNHSPLSATLRWLAEHGVQVLLTTDHGTIRTSRPYKIIGDRDTNTNLRYKQGRNLNYESKHVFEVEKPEDYQLPRYNVSTTYAFATEDYFFAYPNNYNHYVRYYKDTFQHGGVSLEEMIIPYVLLSPKKL